MTLLHIAEISNLYKKYRWIWDSIFKIKG